jgi:hypothetical protein
MVKPSKTAPKKKTGRPAAAPEDIRSERTALRMHTDLQTELTAAAREQGMTRSLFIERILLAHVNARLASRGERMLDGIGKYYSDAEMERMQAASDAEVTGRAGYAALREPYAYRPPVLPPAPIPPGMPRWTPPPPPTRKK